MIALDRLRPSDIEALILALRLGGLSDSTIRSIYTTLRSALDAERSDEERMARSSMPCCTPTRALAAGIDPLRLSGFMGHSKVTTTLGVYAHLFVDDHAETMAALEAMSRPVAPNVVPIRGRR